MPRARDLTNQRFAKLVAEKRSHKDAFGAWMWLCHCDCGQTTTIRAAQLSSGHVRSCGCGVREAAAQPRTHGQTGTPLYLRWRSMLDRIDNKNGSNFHNYGGRGIRICDRWRSFEAFSADVGSTFERSLELDRIDVNGHYEPGNCRWATEQVQQRNKRTNHNLTFAGRTQTVQDWAEERGVKANTIITRLRRGWSASRALSQRIANA